MRKCDVSFSLGDGLRPASNADANDATQFAELETLGELTKIAWDRRTPGPKGGPGPCAHAHDQGQHGRASSANAARRRSIRWDRSSTDIAPGYDHITSGIGAAMIGWFGTALLAT